MNKQGVKTHTVKKFKYKNKTYTFTEPLKVRLECFLTVDFKSMGYELNVIQIEDGFTRAEPFGDPDKEIKKYLKSVFDELLFKKDEELDEGDLVYKKRWLKLIKPPKEKEE